MEGKWNTQNIIPVIDSGDKAPVDLIDDVDEFAVLQKKYSELYI